jgi:hypothetical protein
MDHPVRVSADVNPSFGLVSAQFLFAKFRRVAAEFRYEILRQRFGIRVEEFVAVVAFNLVKHGPPAPR